MSVSLDPQKLAACLACLDEVADGRLVHEQCMSDIHGDAPAFEYLVRSASGEIRRLVEDTCGDLLSSAELDELCWALYYPEDYGDGELRRLSERIRAAATGQFHLLGDLWDRGPRGDTVMDLLAAVSKADVQWGNHDVCWMGAAAGDPVCIATCVRNNMKYGNTAQFEEGYGIDLQPLRDLGMRRYADDGVMDPVQKAINAILFKVEGQAILRHPEWDMGDRLLWGSMDLSRGVVPVYGVAHSLKTVDFPTFDASDPYALDPDEQEVLEGLVAAFVGSERLRCQIQWLYDHGSVYLADGGLLLLHGCVPLDESGDFALVDCGDGVSRSGRELLDWTDSLCRRAWTDRRQSDLDWMGKLWCGWQSTFAGRVVKTFERTYIEDKQTWKEPEDPYYALTCDGAAVCGRILAEFGLDSEQGRIVNGHTPVKLPKGEGPVRGRGRRLVIDGGLCFAYRKTTGIAGYTLVRDDQGLRLVSHEEFAGKDAGVDVSHETLVIE